MSVAEHQRIYRIAHDPHGPYLSKYGHPNGWRIVQCERDWSLRGYTRGAHHQFSPKRWWEVHRAYRGYRYPVATFATLRDAREWCDEHDARSSGGGEGAQTP